MDRGTDGKPDNMAERVRQKHRYTDRERETTRNMEIGLLIKSRSESQTEREFNT